MAFKVFSLPSNLSTLSVPDGFYSRNAYVFIASCLKPLLGTKLSVMIEVHTSLKPLPGTKLSVMIEVTTSLKPLPGTKLSVMIEVPTSLMLSQVLNTLS